VLDKEEQERDVGGKKRGKNCAKLEDIQQNTIQGRQKKENGEQGPVNSASLANEMEKGFFALAKGERTALIKKGDREIDNGCTEREGPTRS